MLCSSFRCVEISFLYFGAMPFSSFVHLERTSLFEKLRELWSPREVMTDDILIGYVASDRVCPRSEGIMLGVTLPPLLESSSLNDPIAFLPFVDI